MNPRRASQLPYRITILAVITGATVVPAAAQTGPPSWDSVGTILRTTGVMMGGYYRYSLPRTDLAVRIGDVPVATALAAGAWAGFGGTPADAVMMGDLVLTAAELRPVQQELARQRIAITAVHNHLAGADPQVTYLHFHAEGAATELARRLDAVVGVTATPRPVATQPPVPLTIDTALVFGALGVPGRARGTVAQVSLVLVPDAVTMHGRVVIPAMGYGTPINVQAVSATRAVATGDFSVLARAVQPVIRALGEHGITVAALHSHLVDESPRIYYIHFWADGPLEAVLAGLRAAADAAR